MRRKPSGGRAPAAASAHHGEGESRGPDAEEGDAEDAELGDGEPELGEDASDRDGSLEAGGHDAGGLDAGGLDGSLEDGELGGPDAAYDGGEAGPASTAALSRPTTGRLEPGAVSLRDPFQLYLREVQRHPLLTPQEERELTVKYQETGDPAIARRLVTANLRLVIKLAYEYRRAYMNMMDLVQEGNIGLMQAVSRFDPYRGVKLSSYSAWWIRAYMLRYILNNWRLVKLGTTQAQRKLFFNLNKQKAKLSAMGIEPTHEVIAERLGVTTSEVVEMDRRLSSSEASLDAPLGDSEGRSVARVELLPSADGLADETVAKRELYALLNEHLAQFRTTLGGKDLVIFDRRLVAEEAATLQTLGDEFGVSRERVRQLAARLTAELRVFLKSKLGYAVELGA